MYKPSSTTTMRQMKRTGVLISLPCRRCGQWLKKGGRHAEQFRHPNACRNSDKGAITGSLRLDPAVAGLLVQWMNS